MTVDDAGLAALLGSGGDHRQQVDAVSGLTAYGVGFRPRQVAPLGSCTASSPSELAFEAARVAASDWERGGRRDDTLERWIRESVCSGLAHLYGGGRTGIALTPSGTDALYLLTAVVARSGRPVHHVVVGASELGGGTLAAAAGRWFSDRSPLGGPGVPGAPIEGLADRCTAEPIYLREGGGGRLDEDAVAAAVEARVEAAIASGCSVVVHLVAHSKTGLRAPPLAACEGWARRHGDRLVVVVDAAQGRLSPPDVRRALRGGFAVLLTGSKFYAGPSFCGALLLPARWAGDPGSLPEALGAWFDRASLPRDWAGARASLPAHSNPGLTLRWVAAMAEMRAYHSIPPSRRARVYATFSGAVHELLGGCPHVDLELPLLPAHQLVTGLGAFPTVFGFRVRGAEGWLGAASLRRLHGAIGAGRRGPAIQLGQPVALGPADAPDRVCLLRVALGAQLVTRFASTSDAGGAWMRATLASLCDQLVDPGA